MKCRNDVGGESGKEEFRNSILKLLVVLGGGNIAVFRQGKDGGQKGSGEQERMSSAVLAYP